MTTIPTEDRAEPTDPWAVEEAVLQALRAALDAPDLSGDDDFFALGGDSRAAVRAITLIREATGIEVPVAFIFLNPSAAKLADAVRSLIRTPAA